MLNKSHTILRRFNIDEPIGREEVIARLEEFVRQKFEKPHIQLIIAEGGMGKSHIIQHIMNELLKEIWKDYRSAPEPVPLGRTLFVDLDMQWSATHTVEGLISTVVEDLRVFVKDEPFEAYDKAVIAYSQTIHDQTTHHQRILEKFEEVVSAFCDCINKLSKDYGIIIFIDTLEEFERLEVNWQTITETYEEIPTSRNDFTLRKPFEFLRDTLLRFERVGYILAGRNHDFSPPRGYPTKSSQVYNWHNIGHESCPIPEEFVDPKPIKLLSLSYADAEDLMRSNGIDFDPDSELTSKLREQIESLKIWENDPENPHVGNKPIFILMLAHVAQLPQFRVMEDQASFEAQLVQQYWTITPEHNILLQMALGKKTYLYDTQLISMQTQLDMDIAGSIIRKLRANPFVRVHRDGQISLQDEFRRLLVEYVWFPRFYRDINDPLQQEKQNQREEERAVLTKTLQYYKQKYEEIDQTIFDLIGDLQYVASPLYAEGSTMLTEQTRKARNQLLELFRLYQEEDTIVRELQILISTIGYYNKPQFLIDRMSVFTIYWKNLRSSNDPIERRDLQILSMAKAIRRYLNQGNTPSLIADSLDEQKIDEIYWHEVRRHKEDLDPKTLNVCLEFRRRHIQHKYQYESDHHLASEQYREILIHFKDQLDYRKEKIPTTERREQAALQVEILLKQAIATMYEAKPNWSIIEQYINQALKITEEPDLNLTELQSEILRQRGWAARRQWKIQQAIDDYRLSLDRLKESSIEQRSLSERYHDLATGLTNLAFAYRYKNAHSALMMAKNALEIHQRMRRLLYVVRTERPLAVINRLLGNHEESIDNTKIALRISMELNAKDEEYISRMQSIQTVFYAADSAKNQFLRDHYFGKEEAQEIWQLFEKFYKKEDQPYDANRKIVNNSFMLGELIQFYYIFIRFAFSNDPDKAHEILDHCISLIRKYLGNDNYRTLLAYRNRLEIYRKTKRYSYEAFVKLREYRHSMEIIEDLPEIGQVISAQINEYAGNLALEEGLQSQQSQRFQQAITHFVDAYFLYAGQIGYNVVMLYPAFENLKQEFAKVREHAMQAEDDNFYLNILKLWTEQFHEALLYPESRVTQTIATGETATHAHDRQYLQGHHFVHSQRILNWLVREHLGDLDFNMNMHLSTEDYHEIAEALCGKANGEIEGFLQTLTLALISPPEEELCRTIRSIHDHYHGSTDYINIDLPEQWPFDKSDWDILLVIIFRAEARLNRLSYRSLYEFTQVVDSLHLRTFYGVFAKLHLAWTFEKYGYTNATQDLLIQTLKHFYDEGKITMTLWVINELARLLSLHGDYLSATLYLDTLLELESKISDDQMRYEIFITASRVLRAWGGISSKRGAPRTAEDMYFESLQYLDRAEELARNISDTQYRRIQEEKFIFYGYWFEDGNWFNPGDDLHKYRKDFTDNFLELYDNLKQYSDNTRLTRMYARIHLQSPHILAELTPDAQNYEHYKDVYYQLTQQDIENTLKSSQDYSGLLGGLARQIELRYIHNINRPDPMHHNQLHKDTGQDVYEMLLADDTYKQIMKIQNELVNSDRDYRTKQKRIAPVLLQFSHDPQEIPEAFRHYFGRVELIAGWVAQHSRHYTQAIHHYAAGSKHIAHSVYSVFHIGMVLRFLEERFRDLAEFDAPNLIAIQREWSEVLLEEWKDDEAFKLYYSDLIEFASLQKNLANLRAVGHERFG